VLTLSRGGQVVASVVLGGALIGMCCTPPAIPSPVEPVPPPVTTVDAGSPDGNPAEPPVTCEFVGPRQRGVKRMETRIVGGNPAGAEAFPFAAALATSTRRQYCGGSVVAQRFILTAAHCQVEAGDLVLVGSTDLHAARAIRVAESRIHPGFHPVTMDWDIAVARIDTDAGVPSVPLAVGITNLDATVIGWGRTSEGGDVTRHLREVSVPLWEPTNCRAVYPSLTAQQVCAGLVEGGKDSCQGDSGGSLLTWNLDHWEQLGIVSYGEGCARPMAPGVYTDTSREPVRRWVRECTVK
jgi:secreted trypsin-like serine protease